MFNTKSPPNKAVNLKSGRQRVLETTFLCSLLILSSLFYAFQKFDLKKVELPPPPDITIIVKDIPRTKPPIKINRPDIPKIPVPSDDPGLSPEVTIDYGHIDMETLIADAGPPVEDIEEIYDFHAVQVKPEIIKKAKPKYPESAIKIGISGTVVTKVLIDKEGNIERAEIYSSIPMLDKAALEAAKNCKFTPAMQRDKPVKVWMFIPFDFRLR